MKERLCRSFVFAFALWPGSMMAQAPDTTLSIREANARLIKANLALLASHYDVNIARAYLIQARLWNNPYFVFNGEVYSNETNEYFHFRNQHLLQLEQTFSVAGKHTNTVRLARINVEMAEKQLEDVLRSLLFEVGNTYSGLAALQEKQFLYKQVIQSYEQLMAATRKQLNVGTISAVEALRLESEYLATKTEALGIQNDFERELSDLRSLLRLPEDTTFFVEQVTPLIAPNLESEQLVAVAVTNRPDLKVMQINRKYQERNLRLQRSVGMPDVKLAYQPRDRGSNYTRPYQGFNLEMFVPLFDRNQGRVKAAEFSVKKSVLEYDQYENAVRNEVVSAFNRYRTSGEGLSNYNIEFLQRLNEMNQRTNENFQKRNISLLQFIDQQRIYIRTNLQMIELRQLYINNANELNFSVGTNIIEF